MSEKSIAKELLEHVPMAILIIGVAVLIIAAAGGLPVGNPPLKIVDVFWRAGLGALGVILSLTGLLLAAKDEGFVGRGIKKFDSYDEFYKYMLKRIENAKDNVCDMTWDEPSSDSPVIVNDADREYYLGFIERVTSRKEMPVWYREVMMFCGLEVRVKKAQRLLSFALKHRTRFEFAVYPDFFKRVPPRWQFLIIDDEEVLLAHPDYLLRITHPKLVDYYRGYYREIWNRAQKIKNEYDLEQAVDSSLVSVSLQDMLDSYEKIEEYNFDHYNRIAKAAINECYSRLREIAGGSVVVTTETTQRYGTVGMELVRRDVKVIHIDVDAMDFWNSDFGRRYFEHNRAAIKRGVQITRVFALTPEVAKNSLEKLREQEQAGVRVLIVDPNRVSNEYTIYDDETLVDFDMDPNRDTRSQRIIRDPAQVKQRCEEFRNLVTRYAKTIEDVLSAVD